VDLVVRSGTVVTEWGMVEADVAIDDGRIAAIGRDLPTAERELDASGAYVLPGGVDPHTHLNSRWPPFDEERKPIDDFFHGSHAAAAGGITTVGDFVYQLEGLSLVDSIQEITREAEDKSLIDFALHVVIEVADAELVSAIPDMVRAGHQSFKFYTNSPDFVEHRGVYLDLLHAIGQARGVAMFHCEDHAIGEFCSRQLLSTGQRSVTLYPRSRPAEVEFSATELSLRMAAVAQVPAYLVHLSLASALEEAIDARRAGQPVFVETRPLYLYLTEDVFAQSDREAAKYVGTPPIRSAKDLDRLWSGLVNGEVDVVATDHVGFTMADKYREGDTFDDVPRGVANLETLIPMLYSEGVATGRISLERMVELTSTAPAKIFGLYPRKGVVAVGSDGDLCVLDPNQKVTLGSRPRYSASDFEVYAGRTVIGWPRYTVSRGDVVFAEGQVEGKPGRGRLVLRPPHN
jgi:dihydropyrimidinase